MPITPNGRLAGLHARLFLGDASGGTSAYASADLRSWEISIDGSDVDLSALDDIWDVGRLVTMSATGSAEKAVVTIDFLKNLTPETQLYATFYRGGYASAGSQVASGVVYLTSWKTSTGRKEAMLEQVQFKFTGAVTTATA